MHLNYKFFILILVFTTQSFLPKYSSSDVGSCARYKLNITFNNGDSLECFIQLSDYDANIKDWDEEIIFDRIKQYGKHNNNRITAYKKIQTINYPEGNKYYKYYKYKYSAVSDEDKIIVDINQISLIKKLDVSPCECGKFVNIDPYKIHFTTQIIEGLSQKEIDLLQTKPYAQFSFKSPGSYATDVCLNYNKDIDEKTFRKICTPSRLYLKNENNIPYQEFYKLQRIHYLEKVKELRKKNIIVIHFYSYD